MKKGIIVDIGKRYVTVLTSEGEFCRAEKTSPRCRIGEEITFVPVKEADANAPFLFFRKLLYSRMRLAAALALAVCIIAASLLFPAGPGGVYAYVSMDINPSVEFGVNRNLEVVKIRAFDEEAETVVSELKDWRGQPLTEVTERFISESEEHGYIQSGANILLSTTFIKEDQQWESELTDSIQEATTEWKTQKSYAVTTLTNGKHLREEAIQSGSSPGKYAIWVAAQEKGQEIDLQDVKEKSVSELAQEFGGLGALIGNGVSDEQWEHWKERKQEKDEKDAGRKKANPQVDDKAKGNVEKKDDKEKKNKVKPDRGKANSDQENPGKKKDKEKSDREQKRDRGRENKDDSESKQDKPGVGKSEKKSDDHSVKGNRGNKNKEKENEKKEEKKEQKKKSSDKVPDDRDDRERDMKRDDPAGGKNKGKKNKEEKNREKDKEEDEEDQEEKKRGRQNKDDHRDPEKDRNQGGEKGADRQKGKEKRSENGRKDDDRPGKGKN